MSLCQCLSTVGISIDCDVGFGVVCQGGYALIGPADGAARHIVRVMICSASHAPRPTLTPTEARDEPPEAEDHPEIAADAAFRGNCPLRWNSLGALVLQEVTMERMTAPSIPITLPPGRAPRRSWLR